MTRYGMAIDLGKCVGCRTCMVACKIENGTPASHFFMYTFRFEEGVFPLSKLRYLPRPCMHCDDPPCVTACPKNARIKWKDGLVLTDADNCQGVRACETACPYGVNYFNKEDPASHQYVDWAHEDLKDVTGGINPPWWKPELEQASTWDGDPNKTVRRVSGAGHIKNTVGKCTFCVHRLDAGNTQTACQQACPVSAIIFGDLDSPSSEVSQAIAAAGSGVFRLKMSAGTNPKVYYLGEPPQEAADLVEVVKVDEGVQQLGKPEHGGGTVPWK
jgi:Fe-S-cluster-containing dehydrogenase component